jgi:hypothetical protein
MGTTQTSQAMVVVSKGVFALVSSSPQNAPMVGWGWGLLQDCQEKEKSFNLILFRHSYCLPKIRHHVGNLNYKRTQEYPWAIPENPANQTMNPDKQHKSWNINSWHTEHALM